MNTPHLPVGATVGDFYQVVEPLMHLNDPQGLSQVYRGRHIFMGRDVYMRLCVGSDQDMRTRFVHEARSLSKLQHQDLLAIEDFGLTGVDGVPFIIQAYSPGQTLRQVLDGQGRVAPERALMLMNRLLDVMATVHKAGLTNRVVEPDNLILTTDDDGQERLQLFSFSALFVDGDAITRMTRTGQFMGSARYLAPEYIEHGEISPRLDVYQAALVLVEMISGRPAIPGKDPVSCVLAHTRGQMDIPSAIRKSRLWPMLSKALALDWTQRYEDAQAFRAELTRLVMRQRPSKASTSQRRAKASRHVLDGRFEVLEKLAEGGFGEVHRGRHVRTHMPVAIKIMTRRPDEVSNRDFRARFLREAQAASRIHHPSVVRIHHYGVLEDRPYIVMELLQGHDLEIELNRNGALAPERLLPIFCESLEALGDAHRHQIVHKDLKPANLFLTHPGQPWETLKLLDFGIARMGQGEEASLTMNGRMLFTANYVAPEYIEAQRAVPQTDVYQMGLILVELLTGELVVEGEQLECVMAHMHGKFNIPEVIWQGPLGDVLRRALAREPEDRFADGSAFAQALREVDPRRISLVQGATRAEISQQDTVAADGSLRQALDSYRRLEYLHQHQPEAVPEIQGLLGSCLEHSGWDADQLRFFERIVQRLLSITAGRPHLGDQNHNRRLQALVWNQQRR